MTNSIVTFFPVGEKNGGMTLLRLNDPYKTVILIDVCIGEGSIANHCDVAQELRNRLPTDSSGRPYIDAFILTHRHQDHLQGIQTHFHLGTLSDYPEPKNGEDKKIVIRELWSSYHFWKQASENYSLCDDAKAFNREMRRRVDLYKSTSVIQGEGDRAIVIGVDPNGKCDGLEPIMYEIGDKFSIVNNENLSSKLSGIVLGPLYQQSGENEDTFNDKNRQSIVLQLTIKEGGYNNQLLLAADAECFVWETLWKLYENNTEKLRYDILQVPHHCSWHSLSHDSLSQDDDPQVSINAKKALSQNKQGAAIVAQSKIIKDNDNDPPSSVAKDEYLTIVINERFYCTNEYPNKERPEPLEFNLTSGGPQERSRKEKSKLSVAALASTKESYPHG